MLSVVTVLAAFVTNLRAMQTGQAADADPAVHAKTVLAALAARDFAKVEAIAAWIER